MSILCSWCPVKLAIYGLC